MKIVIEEYSSDWRILFELEKEKLESVLGNSSIIEHIGSTAVEGLGAKPIIDIMIGVTDFTQVSNYIQPIVKLGYTYVYAYEDVMPYRRFLTKEKDGMRTHHIHMIEKDTEFWVRHLSFRDCLRNNIADREAYFNLKKELAEKEWKDGNDYAAAKTEFIKAIEKKISNQRQYRQGSETVHLVIRPLSIKDAEDWVPFFINNPSDKFLALSFNASPPLEQSKSWIERQLVRYRENRYGLLALTDKITGKLVGMCGLLTQEVDSQHELEIGYRLLGKRTGDRSSSSF